MDKFVSIEYLRGVAASFVVVFHIGILLPTSEFKFYVGGAGVDIFFVISGFIMWITSRNVSPLRFAIRRVIRIVPLYWVLTLFLAVIATEPRFSIGYQDNLGEVLQSLFFVAYIDPVTNTVEHPILRPGWTLNMEMFFYSVMALALIFPRNLQAMLIATVLCAIVIVARVWPDSPRLAFYGAPLVLEFLIGIGLAILWRQGAIARIPPAFGLFLVLFAVLCFWTDLSQQGRLISYGLPSAALVAAALIFEPRIARRPLGLALFLGAASYSIYLTHTIVLIVLRIVWLRNGVVAPDSVVVLLALLACLICGALTYLIVERPVTARLYALCAFGKIRPQSVST